MTNVNETLICVRSWDNCHHLYSCPWFFSLFFYLDFFTFSISLFMFSLSVFKDKQCLWNNNMCCQDNCHHLTSCRHFFSPCFPAPEPPTHPVFVLFQTFPCKNISQTMERGQYNAVHDFSATYIWKIFFTLHPSSLLTLIMHFSVSAVSVTMIWHGDLLPFRKTPF